MAERDPAFLYYDADVALDVSHMNRQEKGCYLDLIQLYRKYHGYTMEQLRKILGTDFDTCWNAIELVLEKDGDIYHIPWLRNSLIKKAFRNEKQRERIQNYWDEKKMKGENNNSGNTTVIPRNKHGTSDEVPNKENGISVDIPIIETETETEFNMNCNRTENLFFGDVPEDLIELAGTLFPSHRADEWQDYVQQEVEKLGYRTKREVTMQMDDGNIGRIDLVAYRNGMSIAIELDNRTAKAKSILKVKHFPAGMVLLRDPKLVKPKDKPRTWNQFPGADEMDLELPDRKAKAALELLILAGNNAQWTHVKRLWEAFKIQNLTGGTFYYSPNKVYSHFINWAKTQKINGTEQQSGRSGKNPGLYQAIDNFDQELAARGYPNPES